MGGMPDPIQSSTSVGILVGLILGAIVNGVIGHHYDNLRAADLAAHPEKLRYIEEYREQYSDAI